MDVRPLPRSLVVGVVVLAVAATACSGASGGSTSPDRVDAIRTARDRLGAPAEQLAAAVDVVEDALADLPSGPRTAAVDALAEGSGAAEAAAEQLDATALPDDTADVRSATEAVDRATTATERLVAAADVLVAAGQQLVTTDTRLAELVATWDERGSRSEIVARLDQTAAAATDLRGEGPDTCPGPMEVRSAAATFVADATRELRDRVAAYDGEGFDTRRAELDEAPFGRTEDDAPRQLAGPRPDDTSCPALQEASTAAAEVDAGLAAMQDALNPTDLAS